MLRRFFCRALQLQPKLSQAYTNLAFLLEPGQSVTLELRTATKWTAQELFLEAIRLDGSLGMAFYGLASLLLESGGGVGSEVLLSDGLKWRAENLYVRAIELDPTISLAFRALGNLLPATGFIRLRDNSTWTRKQLLVQAEKLERQRRKAGDHAYTAKAKVRSAPGLQQSQQRQPMGVL